MQASIFSKKVLGAPTMVTSHPEVLCENAKAVNHLRGMRKGIFKRTANGETSFSIIKIKTEPWKQSLAFFPQALLAMNSLGVI